MIASIVVITMCNKLRCGRATSDYNVGIIMIMLFQYDDVIMGAIASLITSLTIVYWTVYSDADQRKHQSSASLAFVRGIHRGPVNSPHKWPVARKMFPFDDSIIFRVNDARAIGLPQCHWSNHVIEMTWRILVKPTCIWQNETRFVCIILGLYFKRSRSISNINLCHVGDKFVDHRIITSTFVDCDLVT